MIYTYTFTNLSGQSMRTHIDLTKVVAIQEPIGTMFAKVHLLNRASVVELPVGDEAELAKLVAAWREAQ